MTDNTGVMIPTPQMVDEMITDVTMVGRSNWCLGDGTKIELDENILKVIRTKADDLCIRRLSEITAPFFVGRHHNPITNHHDGTYTVCIR